MLRLAALLCLLISACASTPDVPRWSAAPISSDQFESHPAFDPRNGDLYFVRSSPQFSGWRLFVSACGPRRERGVPQPVSFAGADGVEADPFITPDGNELWFISTRSENGVPQRDLDIWRVRRGADGQWGAPQHLPPPINSEGQEWFPRVTSDGVLYFGSNRPGGLGGNDIYRAIADGVGGWRVENLGPAINTPGEEYEAEFSADGHRMVIMADGDLFMSRIRGDAWTQREPFGPEVNTQAMEVGPLVSDDGTAMLFARASGDPALSGEIFAYGSAPDWPPRCRR